MANLRPQDGGAGTENPGEGGLSAELTQAINEEINKAITGWAKRELPKLMKGAIDTMMPTLSDTFMERLAEELPSDEEIAEMEAAGLLEPEDAQNGGGQRQRQGQGQGQGQEDLGEGADPAVNAAIRRLQRENEELRNQFGQMETNYSQALEQAEYADRVAQVNALLSEIPFANPRSRGMVEDYLVNNLYRDEEGNLIGGPDDAPLPVKDFLGEYMKGADNLLATRNVGGAGAIPGGRHVPAGAPTLEQIKPGMSKDEQARVMKYAVSQLNSSESG